MTRLAVIRSGAVASVVAGACWVVKAAAILLTGDQPPVVFEAPLVLFPIALVGLYAALGPGCGRLARSGLVLAVAAEVSALVVGFGVLLGPDDWLPREETVTVLTPFIVLAGFGSFVALFLLGLVVHRTRALPGRWRTFPLVLACSAVPLMAIGGALEVINERLLEVPLLLLGVAWIALGAVLARQTSVHATTPAGVRR